MSLPTRRRSAVLALVLGLAGLLTVASPATAATAATAGSCEDGVTVVVDFTDIGGELEVACAEGDPATGREALESAGFTPTDSMPGMICAIDSRPDPCPEEFDGSYWAYWTTDGDEWVAHTAGADGIDPAPGDIEGWRYNDGMAGPGITPAEATGSGAEDTAADEQTTAAADEQAGADDTAEAEDTEDTEEAGTATDAQEQDGSSTAWLWFTLAGLAVVAAVVAVVVRSRRQ